MEPILLTEPRDGHRPIFVRTNEELRELSEDLISGRYVAMDTERASGFRYEDRLYLLQLKQASIGTFLVDPVEIRSHIGPALQSSLATCTWILHAAVSDLPALADAGLRPHHLFDTEVAGRFLGFDHVNLAAMTEAVLGYQLKKGHGAEDWSRRPLPRAWLRYAALDVELLIDLAEELSARLADAGKLAWAEQEFAELVTNPPVHSPKTFRSLPGLGKLKPRNLNVAAALWDWRDELARDRDLAPGRVLSNQILRDLAAAAPTQVSQTAAILQRGHRSPKHAAQWQRVIDRTRAQPASEWPQPMRRDDENHVPSKSVWKLQYPEAHATLQRAQELLATTAAERDMDPILLISAQTLRELVWARVTDNDRTDLTEFLTERGARSWQLEVTGESLRQLLG